MRLLAALTTAAWLATGFSAIAQISTEEARLLGLEVAWQSQIQLPRTKGIASAHLWAESSGARELAEVEVNGRTVRVSADKLDRDGKAIGFESAKLQAQQEAQFRSFDTNGNGELVPTEVTVLGSAFAAIDRDQDGKISFAEHARFIDWNSLIIATLGKNDAARMLKAKGLEAAAQLLTTPTSIEVKKVAIPRIKLAIVTRNGSVETLDAETGKTLWANTCGDTVAPTFPGAVSKAGVVILQGDRLYVLDWETGKLVTTKQLHYASSNAVAVTDNIAFVSDFSGRVEAYVIGKSEYKQRWGYVIRGRAIGNTVKMHDRDLCGIASSMQL
jgi:outer membrane protein assembly factor BamB